MRAVRMNGGAAGGRRRSGLKPGPVLGGRVQRAGGRAREGTRLSRGSRLAGLRWVPVPLAALLAVLGWLVLGAAAGQNASAHSGHEHGYQAGGLALAVDQMVWMSNDMTGQGPLKVPKGFPMDASMMSGMQPAGDDRLQVDVTLQNNSSGVQRYALTDFTAIAPSGQSWKYSDDGGTAVPTEAVLEPGFQATVALYFDVPNAQSKNLTIKWSRSGDTVDFPVNTSGIIPSPHVH
jgi:hypothetical protein